jgi:alkanesulfonate monooxygenase
MLIEWVAATDVDGFNLAYAVTPESFEDFVDLVVPELTRRGVYKRDYRAGTYREKLFGAGPHLAPPHPAVRYRAGG